MGQVIGDILAEAVGVAISPIPIIAVVLILGSARGRSNGFAFLAGWLLGLAVVGAVVLLVAGPAGASADDGPAVWVGWLLLVLGILAVLLGLKQWRDRPRAGETAEMPAWMKSIDRFTGAKSFAMGFVLSAVNPKNLTLTLAAAATIAAAGLSAGAAAGTLFLFVLVGSLGMFIPLGIYLLMGERAPVILGEMSEWLGEHNAAIMTVLLVVIGAKLVGAGLGAVLG